MLLKGAATNPYIILEGQRSNVPTLAQKDVFRIFSKLFSMANGATTMID